MRYFIIFIISILVSCKTTNYSHSAKKEIEHYRLENIDTLVDIGCGDAYFDMKILSFYPNLFIVLEDLPLSKDYIKKWDPLGVKKKINRTDVIQRNFQNSQHHSTKENQIQIVIGSEDSIPLRSEKYNKVLCRNTLHEFKYKEKMVSELIRILRKNGVLVIVEKIPNYSGEQDRGCDYARLTKAEIISMFKGLTLTNEVIVKEGKASMNILSFTK